MIDDFQVPDDNGYGYDDYGVGKALIRGYIAPLASQFDLAEFYPRTPSDTRSEPHRSTGRGLAFAEMVSLAGFGKATLALPPRCADGAVWSGVRRLGGHFAAITADATIMSPSFPKKNDAAAAMKTLAKQILPSLVWNRLKLMKNALASTLGSWLTGVSGMLAVDMRTSSTGWSFFG
jgi:hypothetical protein